MSKTPVIEALKVSDVFANENFNCRGRIHPTDVADLAKDIEAKGLMSPIIVVPLEEGDNGFPEFKYKIIMGHRRHKAHQILKYKTILAIVDPSMRDERKARSFNLTENLQRADLNILQEANALRHLGMLGLNNEEIAKEVGKSTGWVVTRVQLLNLPESVQQEILIGAFGSRDIRDLYMIFSRSGENATFKAVKALKDAKVKGTKKPDIYVKKVDATKNKMKRRDPREVGILMGVIQDHIGNNLTTRALAWCMGVIDDNDIHLDIQEACEDVGVQYILPVLD